MESPLAKNPKTKIEAEIFEPVLNAGAERYPSSAIMLFIKQLTSVNDKIFKFITPEVMYMFIDQVGVIHCKIGPFSTQVRASGMSEEKHPISTERYIELFKNWFECDLYDQMTRATDKNKRDWVDYVRHEPPVILDEEANKWVSLCPQCGGNRYVKAQMVKWGVPFSMQSETCRKCNGCGIVAKQNLEIVSKLLKIGKLT